MSQFIKLFAINFLLYFLMACQEQPQQLTESYLMQHPDVVKEKVEQCESRPLSEKSQEQIAQCKMVMNVATNLMTLMSAQQQDPEQFGQKILVSQMAAAKARDELNSAQKKLDELKGKSLPAVLTKAKQNVQAAKKAFEEKQAETNTLLAIVGMNSPE